MSSDKEKLLQSLYGLLMDKKNKHDDSSSDVSSTDSDDTSREPSSAGESEDDQPSKSCPDGYDMGKGVCCKKTYIEANKHSGQRMFSGVLSTENEFTLHGVPLLTDDTLDEAENPKLVLIYAPWCGHCRHFKKEYQSLANRLKLEYKTIYAVDGASEQGENALSRFKSEGFPTLVYMIDEKQFISYSGNRTENEVYDWLQLPDSKKGPIQVSDLTNYTKIKEAKEGDVRDLTAAQFNQLDFMTPKIVLFYASWCPYCHRINIPYKSAAKRLYEENPNMTLYALESEQLKQLPLLTKTFVTKFVQGYPTLLCITGFESEPISFTKKKRNEESIVEWVKNKMKITTMRTAQHVTDQLNRQFSGVKESYSTNVKEINDTCIDITGNVDGVKGVVMVHAPWCGHCITMKPIYLEVAESLPNVTFYLVNGSPDKNKKAESTTRLKEKFDIKGYPTIFYLDEKGNRTDFNKERSAPVFKEWVQSQPL